MALKPATVRLTADAVKKSKCRVWCRLRKNRNHFSFFSCTQTCTRRRLVLKHEIMWLGLNRKLGCNSQITVLLNYASIQNFRSWKNERADLTRNLC